MANDARAAGQMAEAEAIYDALSQDADADVRAEAGFRKGMMLADARRFAEAAASFRAVLDEKPEAAGVRLELARMLAAIGEENAARRAIRQAQATGLPDDVALTVRQFDALLRFSRPYGGSISFALAPDSNINRATQARTLDTVIAPLTLSEDARERSGVGAKVAGQAFVRVKLGEGLALIPRVSASGIFYREQAFKDVSGTVLIGVEKRSKLNRISASLGGTWRSYGGAAYARTFTAAADWTRPIGLQGQMTIRASASHADYLRNDLQDGPLYEVSANWERAVATRAGFDVTVSGYRQVASDPGYSTGSAGVTALAWQELGRMTLVASVGATRLEGDERLFLFLDRRREWLVQSNVACTFRQLAVAGFAPSARLVIERNYSTVGLYDYRRMAVELSVSRAI